MDMNGGRVPGLAHQAKRLAKANFLARRQAARDICQVVIAGLIAIALIDLDLIA